VTFGRIREVSHLNPQAKLPPPMTVGLRELPWMRRERIDSHLRRSMNELEALIADGDAWAPYYQSLRDGLEAGLALINGIENLVDESLRGHSIKAQP
jgi:hypothetical protein